MGAISSGQALRMAQHALFGSETAQIDSELLLGAALGATRAGLYAWPERVLSPSEHSRFESLLERRILGEPIAYILGEREFWSLSLRVTPHVLIPRPETELLVETALSLAAAAESLGSMSSVGSVGLWVLGVLGVLWVLWVLWILWILWILWERALPANMPAPCGGLPIWALAVVQLPWLWPASDRTGSWWPPIRASTRCGWPATMPCV
jgi:hypothetical protein